MREDDVDEVPEKQCMSCSHKYVTNLTSGGYERHYIGCIKSQLMWSGRCGWFVAKRATKEA